MCRGRLFAMMEQEAVMRITILAVGRLKEKYWKEALEEYARRLSRYGKIDLLEVEDEPTPEKASPKEEEQIKDREGERLLSRLPKDAYLIALAIKGKAFDSPGMAERIQALGVAGQSHLCFVIGGSLGLAPAVLEKAREHWSFSPLTFPHQLMRVILLEQIYRSFRIARGEPYHK